MSQTATATELAIHQSPPGGIELDRLSAITGRRLTESKNDGLERQRPVLNSGDDVPPPHAQAEVERWNYPKKNVGKLGFAFLSFIIAGMNDAAVGVCTLHWNS